MTEFIKIPKQEHFENGWHRLDTKNNICIWSDEWMNNLKKNNPDLKVGIND